MGDFTNVTFVRILRVRGIVPGYLEISERVSMKTSARRLAAATAGAALVLAGLAPAANAITHEELAQLSQKGLLKSVVVYNLNNDGAGSLRQALRIANDAGSGVTTHITFQRAGVIKMYYPPEIMHARVIIDGTTAPGYVAGGAPVVGIDFTGKQGLKLFKGSDGSEVLGMSIGNAQGDAISIKGDRMTFAGNYLGLGIDGKALGNGDDGIHILPGSDHNKIGTNPTGSSGWVSNVISYNDGNAIVLENASHNTIVSNRVGTDPTGTIAAPNGANGLLLLGPGSKKNTIGGSMFVDGVTGAVNNPTGSKGQSAPTFVAPPLGNLFSGNTRAGMVFMKGAHDNTISGNFIGTTASGNAPLGNGHQGIFFDGAPRNKVIGATRYNQPFAYYNVVAANGKIGIQMRNTTGTVIQGNFSGIGANNATVMGNGLDGIEMDGTASNALIGGPGPLGNVSSGNLANGIAVVGTSSGMVSYNNFLGTFAYGGVAPNAWSGVFIISPSANHVVRGTVASGNLNWGIKIGRKANHVTVVSSHVGTTIDGTKAIPNGDGGIHVAQVAHHNTIGGAKPWKSNVISGNTGSGITLDKGTAMNKVIKNSIGVGAAGVPLPNGGGDIVNESNANVIKGNVP